MTSSRLKCQTLKINIIANIKGLKMHLTKHITLITLLFFSTLLVSPNSFSKKSSSTKVDNKSQKQTLFESYSKILSLGQHIGYVINRYQIDDSKRRFYSTYFIKTGPPLNLSESLQAEADYKLNPITYQYRSLLGEKAKTVDGQFKNGIMSVKITENGKHDSFTKKIPQGAFLSTFLFYFMLKSKEGLKPNSHFQFKTAIAEEDASITEGTAIVGKETLWKTFQVYQVRQQFKKTNYISYITDHGEILATETPTQGLSTEVVATKEEAMSSFGGESSIKLVFGEIPSGSENIVARYEKSKLEKDSNKRSHIKGEGIPPNKGIILKSNPRYLSNDQPTLEEPIEPNKDTPKNKDDKENE